MSKPIDQLPIEVQVALIDSATKLALDNRNNLERGRVRAEDFNYLKKHLAHALSAYCSNSSEDD